MRSKVCTSDHLYISLLNRLFFLAHTEAYEKANILHRDISSGNILIGDRGGLLIDWGLSKYAKDLGKKSRQPYHTVSLIYDKWQHLHVVM